MILPSTLEYAIQAMVFIAQRESDQPVSCREIAEAEELPKRFLLQILRRLVEHGTLKSIRGTAGGYTLAKPAIEISMLEVVVAIQGPMMVSFTGAARFPRVQSAVNTIAGVVRDQLSTVMLSDVVPAKKKRRA